MLCSLPSNHGPKHSSLRLCAACSVCLEHSSLRYMHGSFPRFHQAFPQRGLHRPPYLKLWNLLLLAFLVSLILLCFSFGFITFSNAIFLMFICCFYPPLECKLHQSGNFCVCYLYLFSYCLVLFLEYLRSISGDTL